MIKQAERPITVSFIEGSSCTFDSNDFVEFEILTHNLPMGEIVFQGSPFTEAGLTELGRCVFDYCDHGLSVYQELANMLYEAQHPWLDYHDALEKGVFNEDKVRNVECARGYIMKEGMGGWEEIGSFVISNIIYEGFELLEKDNFLCAFKPIKTFDFHHFKQVKAYTL